MVKFHKANQLSAQVLVASLNFKKIFHPYWKKLLGKPPSAAGYGLARLGHSVAVWRV